MSCENISLLHLGTDNNFSRYPDFVCNGINLVVLFSNIILWMRSGTIHVRWCACFNYVWNRNKLFPKYCIQVVDRISPACSALKNHEPVRGVPAHRRYIVCDLHGPQLVSIPACTEYRNHTRLAPASLRAVNNVDHYSFHGCRIFESEEPVVWCIQTLYRL